MIDIMKIFNQKGAAAIEFAIICPLLLTITFGIVEFGIICFDKATVTNAAREGARAGIVYADPEITDAEIEAVVDNYCKDHLVTFGATPSTPVTQVLRTTETFGQAVTVRVSYQYNYLVLPNFVGALSGNIILSSETTMRKE